MDTIELLQELVRIPSVSPTYGVGPEEHCGEQRIAEYLAEFLTRAGLDVELQPVAAGRTNVVAVREGCGSRYIGLCAHLDTVPAENMTIDPFSAPAHDGCIWGRGACDTKASIAAMVSAATADLGSDAPGVVLIFTCDEENGMTGVRHFLAHSKLDMMGVVIGEPTGGELIVAHKGVLRVTVGAEGTAAHAATPQCGVNAIYRMAQAIGKLQALAEKIRNRSPHRQLGTATLNVGTIRGGQAVNSVPEECLAEIDRRILPNETPESVTREILDALADCEGITVSEPSLFAPGFAIDATHPWVQAVSEALNGPTIGVLPYATDGAFFDQAGIPTVIYGPGHAAQAHTQEEHISIEAVRKATTDYQAVLHTVGNA